MSEEYSEEGGGEEEVPAVEPVVDPAIEDEARKMGWRPEAEFNGTGEWRDADEFVERGKNINGILRKSKEASDARVAELEATVGQLKVHMGKADQRAHKLAVEEHQRAQREAVDEMDPAKFDLATQKMNDLEPPPPLENPSAEDPVFTAWKRDNAWYGSDYEMSAYADSIAKHVSDDMGGVVGRSHMDAVEKDVRRKFSDRFENPRRGNAASVEGGAAPQPRRKTDPHAYANVPNDAKAEFNRFVAEGIYENNDAARKRYADIYFEDDK